MRISDIIFYIQCYYQAFGLGMVTLLVIQHFSRKTDGMVSTGRRNNN